MKDILFLFILLCSVNLFSQFNTASVLLPNANTMTCGGVTGINTVTNQCLIKISTPIITSAGGTPFLTKTLNTSRTNHTMTLLPDGRILVAGGYTSISFHYPTNPPSPYTNNFPKNLISTGTPTNSAEICLSSPPYTCSPIVNTMLLQRAGHTATLLTVGPESGNVLICGGQSNAGTVTNSCEIFITSTTQFKSGPNMTSSRFGHTASLLSNGKVLMSGGITQLGNPATFTPTQEIYDPITNSFTPSPEPLFFSRIYHSAVVLNNSNVAIIGGYNEYNGYDIESKDNDSQEIQEGQNHGTWGFVDAMEIFDKNGARVPVEANQYKLLPYRISNQFSMLKPDGILVLFGGRGNIPVTYFQPRSLTSYSPITFDYSSMEMSGDMSDVRILTGPISGTVSFEEDLELSRPVTGRIINGDIFYEPPTPTNPPKPSIKIGNMDIFLGKTTAELDGASVGYYDENGNLIRRLKADLVLKSSPDPLQVNATVYFYPLELTNLNSPQISTADFSSLTPSIPSGEILEFSDCAGCSITLGNTTLQLPEELKMFNGYNITGRMFIKSLSFSSDLCNLTLSAGDMSSDAIAPVSGQNILFPGATFSNLTGVISNTTDYTLDNTEIQNCLIGNNINSLTVKLSFISDGIYYNTPSEGVTINTGESRAVVRDMLFSDITYFNPKTNQFYFDPDEILTLDYLKPYPIFDHTGNISESGTPIIGGGRNCESDPANDCLRTDPTFYSSNIAFLLIKQLSDKWKDFSRLKVKRANHTTTVLNDGTVIVCGGTDGKQSLDICEEYNKYLDLWTIVSTMTEARAYHRDTLLPNGTVLITGGVQGDVNQSQALDSAEIYYPSVKTFVPTARMNYKRAGHTQTLLPNGNVLITGGVSSGTYLSSAELFITTANIFIPVGSMANPRTKHTATLMKDGRVIIVGGINATDVLSSYEIYDPATNTFSSPGSINYKRHSHTAHLMDDGRVLIFGGNRGEWTIDKVEVFNGSTWQVLGDGEDDISAAEVSNHSSILLPNKRILITGGEKITSGSLIEYTAKNFITDFYYSRNEALFGDTEKLIRHSSVLLPSNYVMVTGGWTGTDYTDNVKGKYYLFDEPDIYGYDTLTTRKPHISSATLRFDRGDYITIYSSYSNLHSVSDASNSGSGGHQSDFGKPRVILRGINNEFMIDLSSQIYISTFNALNWNVTLSTIIVKTPTTPQELPYGWYYLYVCNAGICSDGYMVQASTPRPICTITNLVAEESASTTSIRWNWNLQTEGNSNGFAIFSASNVFITTVPFPSPLSAPATYYQQGLLPNTPSSIKVGCYNIGGFSDPSTFAVAVSTVYTKANPPSCTRVNYASFDTVEIEWDSNGNNPDFTPYRVDISTYPNFSEYSVALSFVNNYKDTKFTIRNLEPNNRYYFRVKARNGNGVETVYDTQNPNQNCTGVSSTFNTPVSTITVGNIVGLSGTPMTTTSIKWSWNKAGGASGYEIYEYRIGIDPNDPIFKSTIDVSVFLSSTSYPYYTQIGLSTNTAYQVKVRSYKQDAQTYGELVYGPFSISEPVYTLAAVPSPAQPNVFTYITTGSFKVSWDSNGNDADIEKGINTRYRLDISETPTFSNYTSYEVTPDSTTLPIVSEYARDLKPNRRYYARVYAINKEGRMTEEAASLGSKYTLAQEVARVYVSSVSLTGVTVNWDPQENSPETIYELRATSVSFESPFISTPIPFGSEYKDTSYTVNGLWIRTTYYFDVAARNAEGVETARIQTTTPAVTLPGPQGAPPASISGLTSPSEDTTISGNLIDNRPVVLFIPKESFTTPQPIAIAKLDSNNCGYTFGGSTITFGIYANEQPYVPITFTFDYFSSEAVNPSSPPDIHTNKSRVVLARYNPQTGQCLPVKTTINEGLRKITAELNHFSIYQLILVQPSSDLNNIKVFPNPFYPNRPGQGMITITNLPDDAKLTIYTISGQKVYETAADATGTAYWHGKNSSGQLVGSGVYLCVIKSRVGKKTIKLAIER
ncbi:MAG: fibronectin type III domain-containing protein [Elusimicrobiota bacterium]